MPGQKSLMRIFFGFSQKGLMLVYKTAVMLSAA